MGIRRGKIVSVMYGFPGRGKKKTTLYNSPESYNETNKQPNINTYLQLGNSCDLGRRKEKFA